MYDKARYLSSGEKAIVVEFGNEISPEVGDKVRGMMLAVDTAQIEGIISYNPTYRSLIVQYDPLKIKYYPLKDKLQELEENLSSMELPAPFIFEVPTFYGGEEFGPDLPFVASHNNITEEEVIKIHTSKDYLVYMLGFTPGFSYLGGMDETIETPRLKTPRAKISGGSVGIAGKQTGIYSIDSPGGWQLIGKTPIKLYDPLRTPPIVHKAGDYIRFVPITKEEFDKIEKDVEENNYAYNIYPKDGEKDSKKFSYEIKKENNATLSENDANKINFISPGMLTAIQDYGRNKFQQFGTSVSGVMDEFSFRVGNILVDNKDSEASIEITLMGPIIEFSDNRVIAITGGNLLPAIDNNPIPMWTSIFVTKGSKLSFKGLASGSRAYLAISGGIDVPEVMESKSTYVKASIGGFEGRAFKKGDILKLNKNTLDLSTFSPRMIPENHLPKYDKNIIARVTLGPQDDYFKPEAIKTFLTSEYTISKECDRMGYRLEGDSIESLNGNDIISDGIAMGAIQVPGNGKPIILMADRQTTGGYTKIASVISIDLPKIAQGKSGDTIKFEVVSVIEAQRLLKIQENLINSFENAFK